jgi:hypothetical protein
MICCQASGVEGGVVVCPELAEALEADDDWLALLPAWEASEV